MFTFAERLVNRNIIYTASYDEISFMIRRWIAYFKEFSVVFIIRCLFL